METWLLDPGQWMAVARIGLGLWWLESVRHKNKAAWLQRGEGIAWAASVAKKHKWGFVRSSFERIVEPRPKLMSYLVVGGELAIGLGLAVGFLTPIAVVAGLALNGLYFVLMIHDWAEQGQNSMMALLSVLVLGAQGWQAWSLDDVFGLF